MKTLKPADWSARCATGGENYLPVTVDVLATIGFTVVFWVVAVRLHSKTLPMSV